MNINDTLFNNHLRKILIAGMLNLENTEAYYDILNDEQAREFLVKNEAATDHFHFLNEILNDQDLTKCPKCGHYNDNIECPVIKCEYCKEEWRVDTKHSKNVCKSCVSHVTQHCDGNPPSTKNNTQGD